MKKLIIFFLLLTSFFANGQGTNVFKYLELKNVDTVGLTRVGQFWYNPTVGKFTFHDASGYKHFSVSGGGITNTAANNELMKSNGTNAVPSGMFSSTLGNLDLGSASLTGNRSIAAINTAATAYLVLTGQSGVRLGVGTNLFDTDGSNIALAGVATGISGQGLYIQGGGTAVTLASSNVGGSSSANIVIGTGNATVTTWNSGHILLDNGTVAGGGGKVGSIGIFTGTGSFGGGEKVIFIGNAVTNPTTNPTGGGIMFVKSSDNKPYWRTPAGVETQMLSGGGVTFPLTSSQLTINNPAATFKYTFTAAAITADRILNLPLTTATATLATTQDITDASLGPFSTVAPGYTNLSGNSLAILKGANTWLAPGTALQVLRVNAAATNLEWAAASGTPGGSNTQVQFNNSGVFGGNANFTINNGTGVVTFGQAVTIPLTPVATTDAASKGYVDGFVLPAATATTDGYLTSVDWTAFNNKPNTAWVTNGNTTITANTSQTGAFTNTFSLNGVSITQNALSSSWVSGFKITPGAHTALTAATEFVSADFDAFTWTWNSGTTATERFRFFRSPTINSTSGTATFTNAYNVYIDPPIAGTTAAFTNGPWALGTGGKVNVNVNGLITTAAVGLRVANNTAATLGVQVQYSPGVDFEGTAWETGSTISAPSIFRLYNKPSTAGSSVGGTMSLDFNGTGSFAATGFTITHNGGITISNATLSDTGDQAILMANNSGIKWNSVGQLKYTNTTGLNTGSIRINGGAITATGAGTFIEFGIGNTFSPTSGPTDYNTVFFNPVINQTSTASGNPYLLNIKPTLTSVLGTITAINYDPAITTVGTHYGIRIVPAVRNAFGLSTATALIHIGAGTATASTGPLKFTAGTLLTTPEAFAVESNANSFYQTKNSTLRYGQGGVIFDNIADANNGTTVETDLYSYTTPANTLAEDGDKVVCSYIGTFNDVTATGQLKVYFGGTAIGNTGALTVSATGGWVAQVLIIRTGSTTARAAVNISTPGASTALYTAETDLTGLTLSGTNILKITGQAGGASGGSNDITAKFSMGYFFPAAHN